MTIANGAYYHDGHIYWQQVGNYTTPGGIVRMDPLTLKTTVVLNNYLGHRFNSPNEMKDPSNVMVSNSLKDLNLKCTAMKKESCAEALSNQNSFFQDPQGELGWEPSK